MNTPAAVGPNGTIYVGGPNLEAITPFGFPLWNITCFGGIGPLCEPFGTISGLTVDAQGTLYVSSSIAQASRLLAFDSNSLALGINSTLWSFSPSSPGEVVTSGGAIGQNGLIYFGTACRSCNTGAGTGHFYALGLQGQTSTVGFAEFNLPPTLLWSVTVDGQHYVTENQSMNIPVTFGTHSWSTGGTIAVSAGTRFLLLGNLTGVATIPGEPTIDLRYAKQYEVAFFSSPVGTGSISPSTGWFGQLSTVNISASPAQGYAFKLWQANTTLLVIKSPTTFRTSLLVNGTGGITALFGSPPPPQNASLTIVAGSGGSVSYSYAAFQGTVGPGTSATIVVPVGAGVLLEASPNTGYVLSSWSSSPTTVGYGNLTAILFRVSAPSSLSALFTVRPTVTSTTSNSSTKTTTTTSTSQTSTGSTSSVSSSSTTSGNSGLHITLADIGIGLVAVGVVVALAFFVMRRRTPRQPIPK